MHGPPTQTQSGRRRRRSAPGSAHQRLTRAHGTGVNRTSGHRAQRPRRQSRTWSRRARHRRTSQLGHQVRTRRNNRASRGLTGQIRFRRRTQRTSATKRRRTGSSARRGSGGRTGRSRTRTRNTGDGATRRGVGTRCSRRHRSSGRRTSVRGWRGAKRLPEFRRQRLPWSGENLSRLRSRRRWPRRNRDAARPRWSEWRRDRMPGGQRRTQRRGCPQRQGRLHDFLGSFSGSLRNSRRPGRRGRGLWFMSRARLGNVSFGLLQFSDGRTPPRGLLHRAFAA